MKKLNLLKLAITLPFVVACSPTTEYVYTCTNSCCNPTTSETTTTTDIEDPFCSSNISRWWFFDYNK